MGQKIQVRRGTDAQRTAITPDTGEPVWTTDTKKFYLGDGTTAGGILIGPSAGGGGAATVGVATITSGQDSVAVTFGTPLGSAPTVVIATVRKPSSSGANLSATIDDSTVSTTGFTAHLSARAPAPGYKLQWSAQ